MSILNELEEVGDTQDKLKYMRDDILDVYKKNPKECDKLLIELNKIDEELNELKKEYQFILEQ